MGMTLLLYARNDDRYFSEGDYNSSSIKVRVLLVVIVNLNGVWHFFVTFASIFDSKLYSLIRSFHKATYPDWIQEHLP